VSRALGYVAADVGGLEPAVLAHGLADAGYTAVDWTMEQFDPLADDHRVLQDLVAVASEAGLSCPQLMVHQDYVTPDAELWEERVARTEQAVLAAAAAGIPTIGVVTGPNRWVEGHARLGADVPEDAAWDLALRAIARVVNQARDTGVHVCLEPCWGTVVSDARTALRALQELPQDLALTVDPSHFVMTGDDVAAIARTWRDRLRHVHLKDAVGRPGIEGEDFWFLLPGEGGTDWAAFLHALDAVGYTGAMSVEFESFGLRDQVFGGDVLAGARHARTLVEGVLQTAAGRAS
jgi:sugar phosphate isomerase/epimerase